MNFKQQVEDIIERLNQKREPQLRINALSLYEKFEGCGVYMLPIGSYKSCGKRTPLSLNDDGINYCKECQKLKVRLGEVL